MMKVSVIVPVFNTDKYLRKCLDSLIKQTIGDFDIIIVNDGSPDGSQYIIEEYCRKYPFVHGYYKENGGLGSARNFGLQFAKGEYIGFVDSDDYVDIYMYEKLYNAAIENGSDLVICDINFVDENGIIKKATDIVKNYDKDCFSQEHYALKFGRNEAYNKLYSRSLFFDTNIRYPDILYEDYSTTPFLIEASDKISYVSEPLYFYVQRENSIMHQTSIFSEKNYDILKGTEIIVSSRNLFKYEVDYKFYIDEVAPVHAFTRYFRNIFFLKDKKLRERTIRRWGSELNRLLPGWYKSKAVRELRSTIKSPVKKFIFDIIIFSFYSRITFFSNILSVTNRYLHYYKNVNS